MNIGKHLAIMVIAAAFVMGLSFTARAQNEQVQQPQGVQAAQAQAVQEQAVPAQQAQEQQVRPNRPPRAYPPRAPRHHLPYYDTYDYEDYYDIHPFRQLRLSPGQQTALQQILKENFTTTDSLRKELANKSEQLQTLLQSQNPDKSKLSQLSREIGDLRGQMLSAHVDMRSKLAEAGIPTGPRGPRGGYGYWDCPGGCWGAPGWNGPHGHRHGAPCWGPGMMMGPGMMDW